MIEASADAAKLQGSDVIEGLVLNSEKARALGWSPEDAVQNVAKVMSGLTGREAKRSVSGLVEGITSFDEKAALEMKAPAAIAGNDRARLEWARQQLLSSSNPAKLAREMFGGSSAYVMKFLTGQTSPETAAAMQFAQSDAAAAQEQSRVMAARGSAEGIMGMAEGTAGRFNQAVGTADQQKAAIRTIARQYLEFLKRTDPAKYQGIALLGIGEQGELNQAARDLWYESLSPEEQNKLGAGQNPFTPPTVPASDYSRLSPENQLAALRKGQQTIINDYSMHFNPTSGSDERGARNSQQE